MNVARTHLRHTTSLSEPFFVDTTVKQNNTFLMPPAINDLDTYNKRPDNEEEVTTLRKNAIAGKEQALLTFNAAAEAQKASAAANRKGKGKAKTPNEMQDFIEIDSDETDGDEEYEDLEKALRQSRLTSKPGEASGHSSGKPLDISEYRVPQHRCQWN